MDKLQDQKFNVFGILRESRRWVYLRNGTATPSHVFSKNIFVGKAITAQIVAVAGKAIGNPASAIITSFHIPLGGFCRWFVSSFPKREKTEDETIIRLPDRPPIAFSMKTGIGSISISWSWSYDDDKASVEIRPMARLNFCPTSPISLVEAQDFLLSLGEFLIIITDQQTHLGWPSARVDANGEIEALYVRRFGTDLVEFSGFDRWLLFSELAGIFGELLESWIVKRETSVAAFHLYLATRRGKKMYNEHRFLTLIFGLESLHRRSHNPGCSHKHQERRQTIVSATTSIPNSKDRLPSMPNRKRSFEPSLKDRIHETIASLPLDVDPTSLSKFASDCAKARNFLSHGGELSSGEEYDISGWRLVWLCEALEPIFHAAILQEIGIPEELLRGIFTRARTRGRSINSRLARAGLPLNARKT